MARAILQGYPRLIAISRPYTLRSVSRAPLLLHMSPWEDDVSMGHGEQPSRNAKGPLGMGK